MSPPAISHALASLGTSRTPLHLLLDYDGTLVPFASLPELARPDEGLLELLRLIARRRDTHVEIVSGRDRDTLGAWLGELPITLRAEHGMWIRGPSESAWRPRIDVDDSAVARAARLIDEVALAHGGRVERKRTGTAWHYRGLDVPEEIVADVAARLAVETRTFGFEVLRGACVVELRARGVHKGDAVRAALARRPDARILAAGDDVTDEDMFRALRESDVGVLVGSAPRATAARLRVPGVAACRALLAELAS